MPNSYTPDLEFIRQLYIRNAVTPVSSGHPDVILAERGEQFDRAMKQVRSEAIREQDESDSSWRPA